VILLDLIWDKMKHDLCEVFGMFLYKGSILIVRMGGNDQGSAMMTSPSALIDAELD
jgi:hypothetical protein